MKKISFFKLSITIAIVFTFVSCNKNADKNMSQAAQAKAVTENMMLENGTNPDEASISIEDPAISGNTRSANPNNDGHYLYTESNEAEINRIMIYKILSNGSLHLEGTVASGGAGKGKGLGSQGAVTMDKQHEWLYAVNAGSNSVSSFKIHSNGSLSLTHTENSGGTEPNSISVYGNLLYVLNHGSDNIHGLRIGAGGMLTHIESSTMPLSGIGVDAPQISFTPGGESLAVTEKATNMISIFPVKNNGSVGKGIYTPSIGKTPFGFDFSRDKYMIVANAAAAVVGASTTTSYFTGFNGKPHALNGAVPNFQGSTCWLVTTKFGRFAFTSNTGTNNISSYYIAPWGDLYLVHTVAATSDLAPADIVVAANNYYVYALTAKSNTISRYHRKALGGLEYLGSQDGVPLTADGLATY